jgi:hypothetical protein
MASGSGKLFAQPVEPGSVQIIEQRRGISGLLLATAEQRIATLAAFVVRPLLILERQRRRQPLLQPAVEVDEVRVDVVEHRSRRHEAQGDCQASGERLDQPSITVSRPVREQVRNLPALPASPFQRRPHSHGVNE